MQCFTQDEDLKTGECVKDTRDNHERHEDSTGFTWMD